MSVKRKDLRGEREILLEYPVIAIDNGVHLLNRGWKANPETVYWGEKQREAEDPDVCEKPKSSLRIGQWDQHRSAFQLRGLHLREERADRGVCHFENPAGNSQSDLALGINPEQRGVEGVSGYDLHVVGDHCLEQSADLAGHPIELSAGLGIRIEVECPGSRYDFYALDNNNNESLLGVILDFVWCGGGGLWFANSLRQSRGTPATRNLPDTVFICELLQKLRDRI